MQNNQKNLHFGLALVIFFYLFISYSLSLSLSTHGDGRNAMHWAARNGQTEICEWLWGSHGVDVNHPTKDGTTPFHWAVWQGHLDTCRWLVDVAGADWSTLNSFGCNAVQWAAQCARGGSAGVEACAWLRAKGLNLGVLNRNGHSALHKAALKGHAAVCEWLLADGANGADGGCLGREHMRADRQGNTPASMARDEGFEELAHWLTSQDEARRHNPVSADAVRETTVDDTWSVIGIAAERTARDRHREPEHTVAERRPANIDRGLATRTTVTR